MKLIQNKIIVSECLSQLGLQLTILFLINLVIIFVKTHHYLPQPKIAPSDYLFDSFNTLRSKNSQCTII